MTKRGVVVLVVCVVLGLAAACQSFRPLAGGDEPPIRVRGGSVELELISTQVDWEDIGNGKKWKITTDPDHVKPDYEVIVSATDISKCKATSTPAKRIELVYGDANNDRQTIEIKLNSTKTFVSSKEVLRHETNGGKFLRYSLTGNYIKRIMIDNDQVPLCTFDAYDAKLRIGL